MVTVELRIFADHFDVSVDGASRTTYAQTMTVGAPDKSGGRQVLGFAGRGDLAGTTPGSTVHRAFDPSRFDPDLAHAATYFVCARAQRGVGSLAFGLSLTRVLVKLVWPEWGQIQADARLTYLRGSAGSRGVVGFADVAVNGRPAATWRLSRRLLGRAPVIASQKG